MQSGLKISALFNPEIDVLMSTLLIQPQQRVGVCNPDKEVRLEVAIKYLVPFSHLLLGPFCKVVHTEMSL